MDKADIADGGAKHRMCNYFHGQLETCYHQFRTFEFCVSIWSKTVAQIGDDPASIPLFRSLDAHKVVDFGSDFEERLLMPETLVEQIQSLAPQVRHDFTPAFIESAENIFGESDQTRWPTGMLLTRHLRQWDMERTCFHCHFQPLVNYTTLECCHCHCQSLVNNNTLQHCHRHCQSLVNNNTLERCHCHSQSLVSNNTLQRCHRYSLPPPSGVERTIEGPPSKRQKTERGEGESESALPSIVVSPPGEHRASLLPPLDNPMIPTSQLPQWKLEPDSNENEAPRTSGFGDSTAQQQQTRIKTEPDTETTEAQTGSGRKDSLYPRQQ
ncbi:hypothetical protein BC567DRAFT_282350 [Phyllosticta citribraziliensis]